MTALKPIENRRVRAVAAERYPLNKICAHPECKEPAVDPHHAFPRSQIAGDSWFVEVLYPTPLEKAIAYGYPVVGDDGTQYVAEIIPHVAGLCRAHHEDVEEHRAWIKLEEAVWNWYDQTITSGQHVFDAHTGKDIPEHEHGWALIGPLNPQPGSVEGKPKRKRFKGEARRTRKTISIRVPADAGEDGAALLDEGIEELEQKISGDDHRPPYYTIMSALDYTNLNTDATDFEEAP